MNQKLKTLRVPWQQMAGAALFPELAPEVLGEISTTVGLLYAGSTLCQIGDSSDRMWLLVEGYVNAYVPGGFLVRRQAGEVVGEQGLLDGTARSATLVAGSEGATVLSFGCDILVHPDPCVRAAVHLGLAKLLSKKLRDATTQRSNHLGKLKDWTDTVLVHAGKFFIVQQIASPDGQDPTPLELSAVVLFSDVVGFATRTKGVEPGEVRAIVDAVLSVQCDAIEEAGGHVDKFVGDQVMAFWIIDTPESAEDVCRSAVRAARACRVAVRRLQEPVADLDVRIGLHVGPVVACVIGSARRKQYTLLGETVNTAARFEQVKFDSGGGGVRVSDELHQCLPDAERRGFEPFRATAKESGLVGWTIDD